MVHQTITIIEANAYFQKADKQAIRFLQHHKSIQQIKNALARHEKKYADIIGKPASDKLPVLLIVFGHLAAAIVEGSTLAPFFGNLMSGWGYSANTLQIISYFPVLVLFGYSLMVGNILHQAQVTRSRWAPNTIHGNWAELGIGLILGGIYIWALYWATIAAADLLTDQPHITGVILSMGGAELLLGYFAISGWQVAYAYGKKYWFEHSLQRKHMAMLHWASGCEQSYSYYELTIKHVNSLENIRCPVKSNGRIEAVLAFNKISVFVDVEVSEFIHAVLETSTDGR